MNFKDYINLFVSRWALIALGGIIGLVLGGTITYLLPPKYNAETQLYVSVQSYTGGTDSLVQGISFSQQVVNSYVSIAESSIVLEPVIEELSLDTTPTALAKRIVATTPPGSVLINIKATSESPEQAADIANAVGKHLRDVVDDELEGGSDNSVTLVTTEEATVPQEPDSPKLGVNLTLGFLIGVLTAVLFVILRRLLDNRIHGATEIEELTDIPVIGKITENSEGKTIIDLDNAPWDRQAEAFRHLRTNLRFLNACKENSCYVITSSKTGEGKTSTTINLGIVLAQAGAKVLIIEADLRRPAFATYLGIEGGAGLTDVIIGRAEAEDVIQEWSSDGLEILPAGQIPPNPSELLGSDSMKDLIASLREQYDYVLIDTPPVLAVADALVVENSTDGALVVTYAHSTKRPELKATLDNLNTAGAQVLGVIINRVEAKSSNNYVGHYAYESKAK